MNKIINLYKPLSLTPLEAIDKFRLQNTEYKDIKMGYAGRLDPMAQGVLVVLCSDLSSKQVEYSNLDKEYVADIIFGFETDTFDMLGVASNYTQKKVLKLKIEESLKSFKGDFSFKLPQYSSYIIKGKPLYWWARNKR